MRRIVDYIKYKLHSFNAREFFKSILWAASVALLFRTLLFEPFRIPSSSMNPCLQIGDYLFTSKYSYGYSNYSLPIGTKLFEGRVFSALPKRGDVIIFKGVQDPWEFYIKRVIGLPGEKIQVLRGVVHINGVPIPREDERVIDTDIDNVDRVVRSYTEVLDSGKRYRVFEDIRDPISFPSTTPEYIVPVGHVFLMGDNRNNSIDSRFLSRMGYVPVDNIVSKAQVIVWSRDLSIFKWLKSGDSGRAFKEL